MKMMNAVKESMDELKSKAKKPKAKPELSPKQKQLQTLVEQKEKKNERTPLHFVAQNGSMKAIEVFLKYSENIEVSDKHGLSPVHLAAWHGHSEMVSRLLEMEFYVDSKDKEGRSVLYLAVESGNVDVVDVLLNEHYDPMVETLKEWTPLHLAAFLGHLDIISSLMAATEDLSMRNNHDDTPLHLAASANQPEAVALLISDKRCKINAQNLRQMSPLHCAVDNGHQMVIEHLLVAGANLKLLEKSEKTALGCACRNGAIGTVDMIMKAERFQQLKREGLIDKNVQFSAQNRVEVDLDLFKRILWRVTSKHFRKGEWKSLAEVWGFTQDHILVIEYEFAGPKSWKAHGYRMCVIWLHGLNKDDNAMRSFYEGLVEIGRKRLAEEVRRSVIKKNKAKKRCVVC